MAFRNILVDGGVDNIRTLASGDKFAGVEQCLSAGTTDLQPAGTTLESLVTYTIDGGTLSANKMSIVSEWRSVMVSTTNRRRHQVSFNGTTIADFDTSDASSLGLDMKVVIMRESNTVVRCFASAIGTAISSINPLYTKITSLDLTTNGYDLVYKIRNYTTTTDSTLHFYNINLKPAP